jgi:hypothetical protein
MANKKPTKPAFGTVREDCAAMTEALSELPEEQHWTEDELVQLGDIRHYALRLANEIETTLAAHESNFGLAD